ncbi:MAG: ribosome silencing factor [Thermodesulfovibrionales bacterium]
MSLEGAERALAVARLALDKKASDVVVLEMRDLVAFTDYFVICSGQSSQQVKAIVEHIEETLANKKVKPLGVEGRGHGRWVLMDYNDVIVHVFDEDTRKYYELEKLWLDAPRVPLDEDKVNLARKDERKARG